MSLKKQTVLTLLAATALVSGCAFHSLASRHETAAKIAQSGFMEEHLISAGLFSLTIWEKIRQQNAPADIYIEGDGLAWLSKTEKSLNPTPPDPMTLRLAAEDNSDNVVYMARPCQYTGWNGTGACPDIYWTTGRTAPEVIESFDIALDRIKEAHGITGFNLIGYSGGAAVAALIADKRKDILSLRTVAGNTDYTVFSSIHGVSSLSVSINPIDVAHKIVRIPQRHFIGSDDKIVPEDIFKSWQKASGINDCVQSTVVPGATHEKGWVEHWPDLLALPVSCPSI